MTVSQLIARLKQYPDTTTVLIMREKNRGVSIEEDVVETRVRPDVDLWPSSVILVPKAK